jgi:hypothetical protein
MRSTQGMSTRRESLDRNHDVVIYPINKLRANHFRCQVHVLRVSGEWTQSTFVGDGKTEYQARESALAKARQAVLAGRISY